MDYFRCLACFVAIGFQFAYRRSPDPLATRGGIGRSGHQLTERTTKCSLKTSLRSPGWIKEEPGARTYCSGNNRGQAVEANNKLYGLRNRTPYIAIRLTGRKSRLESEGGSSDRKSAVPTVFGRYFLAVTRSAI